MGLAVVKALLKLTCISFAVVGAASVAGFVALVCGKVSVAQAAALLQASLDYTNVCLGGFGVAAFGTAARSALPHAISGFKTWFQSIVREQIEDYTG